MKKSQVQNEWSSSLRNESLNNAMQRSTLSPENIVSLIFQPDKRLGLVQKTRVPFALIRPLDCRAGAPRIGWGSMRTAGEGTKTVGADGRIGAALSNATQIRKLEHAHTTRNA
jgi:hypothetical protein